MLAPNWYPGNKQLRQFAAACLPGFGLIGWVVLHKAHSMTAAQILWGIGAVAFIIGMIAPRAIQPLYSLLMAITLPIGWLISNIFLRIIFYGLFTPVGLLFKLTGRDALNLKRQQVSTYWRPRVERTNTMDYYRQS